MKQHFKGVVWPRGKFTQPNGKAAVHRYVIIGMLVTSESVPELEQVTKPVVDSACAGLSERLASLKRRKPRIKLGDASSVLTSLTEI